MPVTASLASLTANTTYDFKIVATNKNGEKGEGKNATFKTEETVTPPLGPKVETKAASLITTSSATLNGSVNPGGNELEQCKFEYGTTTSYGKEVACSSTPSGSSPVEVSAPLTGLAANTEYDFRIVVVVRSSQEEVKGSNATFKTAKEEAVTCPTAEIRQLLKEVSTAKIPHGIRFELSALLEDALRSLKGCDRCDVAAGGYRALVVPIRALTATRHQCTTRQAFEDLQSFIAVIGADQRRHRPQIPPDLASAWIQRAQGIASSLACWSEGGSDQSGW
jgi:hypothetical protein